MSSNVKLGNLLKKGGTSMPSGLRDLLNELGFNVGPQKLKVHITDAATGENVLETETEMICMAFATVDEEAGKEGVSVVLHGTEDDLVTAHLIVGKAILAQKAADMERVDTEDLSKSVEEGIGEGCLCDNCVREREAANKKEAVEKEEVAVGMPEEEK
jgi:hypothetical protein